MLLTNLTLLNNLEIEKQRQEICNRCENFSSVKICKKCGCIMPAKWKFKFADCPEQKWPILEDTD
jgi:hypothetical protein